MRWCALSVLALAAACGGAPEQAGPASGAARPAVTLAPHARLAELLPNVDGWTRGPSESAALELPAPATHAATSYARDGARVDLAITDTGGQAEFLEATLKIAGTSFERTSENGYFRGATIGGAPAVESWNHVDRLAELTVIVSGRFLVHATASGLESIDAVKAMVERVPFDRLAALTPGT